VVTIAGAVTPRLISGITNVPPTPTCMNCHQLLTEDRENPHGSGLTVAYRWPIPPADNWAILACERAFDGKRLAGAARRARRRRSREAR
jgi:hypothetical protein